MARDWRHEQVNDEWWATRQAALTRHLAKRLADRRKFIDPDKMIMASSLGLGWDQESGRWCLPCCDVHGQIRFAKAWRGDKETKWLSGGRGHISGQTYGRLWDLPWIIRQISDPLPIKWNRTLFLCAGEWDTIMLRCAGFAATCWTDGETAAVRLEHILAEMGGEAPAIALLSSFENLAIVFDCDEAGRRGSKIWYNTLKPFIAEHDELSDLEIIAIDLRASPGFEATGMMDGWDLSDFIVWSREERRRSGADPHSLGPSWLFKVIAGNFPDGLLDVDLVLSDTMLPPVASAGVNFRTASLEELVEWGVSYAMSQGSRHQGAFHMAYKASRSGWTYAQLAEASGAEAYKRSVDEHMPKPGDEITLGHILGHFKRALMDSRDPDVLTSDLANMYRLQNYFPFLMFHEVHGWMWWSGYHWEEAKTRIHDHATMIAGRVSEEADQQFALGNKGVGAMLKKWAKRSQSTGQINNIVSMAQRSSMFRPLPEFGETWDSHYYLLATPDGVVDLEDPFVDAGNNVGHKIKVVTGLSGRNLFMSQTTRGRLVTGDDPNVIATRESCQRLLSDWHRDPEITLTLQEIAGWCLWGQMSPKLFVMQGVTRSGKSTLLEGLQHALGPLSWEIQADALARKASGNNKIYALAGLSGRRMLVIKEVGEQGIDPEAAKMLTGEQSFTARKAYMNYSLVENVATTLLTSNHNFMEAGGFNDAIAARLVVIPWAIRFRPPEEIERAQRIMASKEPPGQDMSEETAKGIVIDLEAGDAKPMNHAVSKAMQRGLRLVRGRHGESAASQAMADFWLQWALDGWLRCLARGGDYLPNIAPSIKSATHVAVEDEIDQYFTSDSRWVRVRAADGTVVGTTGLCEEIKIHLQNEAMAESRGEGSFRVTGIDSSGGLDGSSFARSYQPWDTNTQSLLGKLIAAGTNGSRVLGKLLEGRPGFTNMDRQPSKSVLWPNKAPQTRAWRVPYRFVGDDRHEL